MDSNIPEKEAQQESQFGNDMDAIRKNSAESPDQNRESLQSGTENLSNNQNSDGANDHSSLGWEEEYPVLYAIKYGESTDSILEVINKYQSGMKFALMKPISTFIQEKGQIQTDHEIDSPQWMLDVYQNYENVDQIFGVQLII